MANPHDTSSAAEPKRRVTKQRVAISEVLGDLDSFQTAQEIYDVMLHRGDDVSLTTVYRTLQTMQNEGAVDTILNDEGESLYRACSDDHHHHLVCRRCGLTIEISAKQVEQWTKNIASEHGFTQPDHMIEISGLCEKCSS